MKMLLSLWTGLGLLILSVIAFFAGTLPDNPESPIGDMMRWIVWPVFIVWIIARVVT